MTTVQIVQKAVDEMKEKLIKNQKDDLNKLEKLISNEKDERIKFEIDISNKLKSKQDQIDNLTNGFSHINNIVDSKYEEFNHNIIEEVNRITNNTLKQVNEKLKLFTYYDRKLADFQNEQEKLHKSIKDNLFNIETNIKVIEEKIKKEINDNNMRIDYLEKKINDNYTYINKEFFKFQKDINTMKEWSISFKSFKEVSSKKINELQSEQDKREESVRRFINVASTIFEEYEKKFNEYQEMLRLHVEELKIKANELYYQINDDINKKFEEKIDELNNSVIKQEEKQFEYLGRLLQERQDNQVENINKLIDYANQVDKDLLNFKDKLNSIENSIGELNKKNSIKNPDVVSSNKKSTQTINKIKK